MNRAGLADLDAKLEASAHWNARQSARWQAAGRAGDKPSPHGDPLAGRTDMAMPAFAHAAREQGGQHRLADAFLPVPTLRELEGLVQELAAIGQVAELLQPLEPHAQRLVLRYLLARASK